MLSTEKNTTILVRAYQNIKICHVYLPLNIVSVSDLENIFSKYFLNTVNDPLGGRSRRKVTDLAGF